MPAKKNQNTGISEQSDVQIPTHEASHEYMHDHQIAHTHDQQIEKHVHDHQVEEHTHDHSIDEPVHTHEHTHQNTKAVINRLSRAIGHLEAVRKMVEDGRDCSEVLIQLAAVRSAINNTGKVILEDHIEHCIVDAIENGDHDAVEKLNKAINQFVK